MTPLFEARRLNLRYRGHPQPVVKRISWAQTKGEAVVLRGDNGSGKSTVFRGLTGDPRVTVQGEVLLRGERCKLAPRFLRRAGVRWVPQISGSFDTLSVAENLWMAARAEGADDLGAAFELFPALRDLWRHQARHLSGGQRRMLDLALLAFCAAPTLLWLDEPLASLSAENAARFIVFLDERIAAGTSLLLATHRRLDARFPMRELLIDPEMSA